MVYMTALLSELKNDIGKNIYCFGAGKAFDYFIKQFAGLKLENNIKAVVDNNPDVVRLSKKIVNSINIPIISLEHMLNDIMPSDCILITTAAYEEIIEQLEKIEKLKGIKYYIYSILRIEQYDYDRQHVKVPSSLSTCKDLQIPKIIHYCWFGKNEMPIQYKEWMKSWKYYCPDYEIVEWNEDNYDVHKNKYMSQAYEMKKWAFVSDYARIDIINEYGGVYLDTDVELVKNIDVMLMNDSFCGFETSKYVNYGLGFGARKNNLILGRIKEYYDDKNFIWDEEKLEQIVCPFIQTEIMKEFGLKCNGEFQIVEGMAVYPSRILCGMSPYSFRVERNPIDTYAIHHFEGSWVDDKQGKNKLISNMKKWSNNDNYIYSDL